jgi:hypothetical protein
MHVLAQTPDLVHYLPILTTVVSAAFLVVILRRWMVRRSGPHLLWWAFGVFAYGLGTALESSVTLFGNSVVLNKSWYIAGALLGGYPLAQGTVFLLLKRRTALILTWVTVPFIVATSVLVIASPVVLANLEPHRPTGDVLGWTWVRWMTPFINLYAAAFLIGGAILSMVRYMGEAGLQNRAIGNGLIAVGAILPGIGGSMAKGGMVEALYVGEFVGILLIWAGYYACTKAPVVKKSEEPARVAAA